MLRPDDNRRARECGFTFIEVLAALLFLAILVPAILSGLTITNRAAVLSARRSVAAELAENKLNEELIGSNWQSPSSTSGDFGQDYPFYRWQMSQTNWGGDATNLMTELTMEVFFPVQGVDHSFRLTTLVSAPSSTPSPSPSPTPS
jgi:Tfp pilus assembly protein PilV